MGSRHSPTKVEEAGAWSVEWSTAELCRGDEFYDVLSNQEADIQVLVCWSVGLDYCAIFQG